ncbi:hypothetical protein QBC34DRAFT_383463 [Podospora aff. communis PSN243]|uniref:Uncharacterized protein n=1 Tax=Podospora aff. communis PSN243 TaxID=3040156 RepID=A0AAV9GEE4_9PEZI|nr:hypothetical protein QBC34DRAFT_383463 [Podospora aff. communis PSN243]
MIDGNTLFITLQYLRTEGGHWCLYNSSNTPPKGFMLHGTDANRAPLDLYKEVRAVSNPRRSGTLVVILKIAHTPGMDALEFCANSVHLMDPRYLPPGERQWTCRVWVKEVLRLLNKSGYIKLPADLDTIEQRCQIAADINIGWMGNAKVYNDLSWMNEESRSVSRTSLMDIDAVRGRGGTYYGSSPMVIDSSGARYYGTKPMAVDSSSGHYYG